jgi:hypothetical protein
MHINSQISHQINSYYKVLVTYFDNKLLKIQTIHAKGLIIRYFLKLNGFRNTLKNILHP